MSEDLVKITHAVYKLLDGLPDQDPLKNKAKEKALAILEEATLANIIILERYLALAKDQGWISDINFLIVKKEYAELKKAIPTTSHTDAVKPAVKPAVKVVVQKPVAVESYSARQQKILEVLKRQPKAQVSDLIKSLPKVTKRTIRRDLDELLKMGKIARAGEFNQVFYRMADGTR